MISLVFRYSRRRLACLSQFRSVALVLTVLAIHLAEAKGDSAEPVDYLRDIKPLLTKHCSACHSPLRQKSGFRIDTAQLLIQGGDMGAAVVPGKSSESPLIHAVLGIEGMPHMPPDGSGERLNPEQVELLRRWIDEGAEAPVEPPASDPRLHWSYQPIERPPLPAVATGEWSMNPIDAFIAAEHVKRGLTPRPEAERHVLLRRVYLDLTGLPPTREELRSFLADPSPMAYENVVDRLLKSPRYGERWGRHWMDVWRYSDWAGWGKQIRDSQPHIWHWRDWIIESLNADRPYDQMVVEMLAADELNASDMDKLRATGFLARNFKLLSREQWMQDTVEHTAKAFLGLTVSCARCHDHLTDPIDQVDYYRMRSIFEPHHVRLDRIPGVPDTADNAIPRVFDKDLGVATYLFVRGDERNPDKNQAIAPGVPSFLQASDLPISEIQIPQSAFDPERQEFVIRDDLAASEKRVEAARKKLDELKQTNRDPSQIAAEELELAVVEAKHASFAATVAIEQLEQSGDTSSDAWATAAKTAVTAQRQLAIVEACAEATKAKSNQTKIANELADATKAGDSAKSAELMPKLAEADKKVAEADSKLVEAEATAAKEPTTSYAKRTVTTYPSTSTGRRLALAHWIVDPRNPLTARVAANHIWARHFDAALVPSVFNFGISGEAPVNQPLLDWLAAELVEPLYSCCPAPPWSMKHLHRLIVTSKTYRMQSTTDPSNLNIDPDNRYLWRAPTRRMEAEVVRDSALYVAGQLDETMGGPDIAHDKGLSVKRRSLYFQHAAEKQMLFLKLFDCASVGECYERRESVIPQQALALANSELTLVQARLLARQLSHEVEDDSTAFVTGAMEQVLARPALPAELSVCLEFLSKQEQFFATNQSRLTDTASKPEDAQKPAGDAKLRAREQLVHALMNHNDFVTIR